jgi:uncharacterized RDD family membrane protein YckC
MKNFSARETLWLQELDGLELAGFRRRAFAFILDWVLISIILTLVFGLGGLAYIGVQHLLGHATPAINLNTDSSYITINPGDSKPSTPKHFNYQLGFPAEHAHPANESFGQRALNEAVTILSDTLIPVLYFGLFLWQGNGRTPGKRLLKIRVVSLVHTHIHFWHAVERALGYGAALLEGGFGFIQFFLHPYRRCAQDRLAETIVVNERSYQQKFPKALGTPAEADTTPR